MFCLKFKGFIVCDIFRFNRDLTFYSVMIDLTEFSVKGAVHKLRRQDFEDLGPPPPSIVKFTT